MRRTVTVLFSLCAMACGATAEAAPADHSAGDEAAIEEPAREAEETPPTPLTEEEAAQTYAQAMQVHIRARETRAACEEARREASQMVGEVVSEVVSEEGSPVEGADSEIDSEIDAACPQASQLFGLAADTWRALVGGRQGNEDAEWIFMLAQALYHSGRFEAAAEQADRYLTLEAPQWRAQAAPLLVGARERALLATAIRPRTEPPEAQGDSTEVRAIDVPPPIAALADARTRFVQVMAAEDDASETRRAYRLDNALLLYRYGDWERAQPALQSLFVEGCSGDAAWEGGAIAWRALRHIALRLSRHDAVQALGEEIVTRECTFVPGPPSCGQDSDDPRCLARADRVAWRLRGGMQFLERAQRARGEDRQQFAIRAGEAFLAALEVRGELGARGRVEALVEAGRAFRLAGDAQRAAAVDERIIADLHSETLDESDRPFGLAVVGAALARQLDAAMANSANPRIVELAVRLLGPDFDLPPLSDARARARTALPEVLTALGRHADASTAYAALAEASEDPAVRREAELRSALTLVEARGCRQGSRMLRELISSNEGQPEGRDAVVRAQWQLATCQRSGSREHTALLEQLTATGVHDLGTDARDHVAEAAFLLADRGFDADTQIRIRVPRGENIEAMVGNLRAQVEQPSALIEERIAGYRAVSRLGVTRWTVAARQRSGAALEALDRAIVAASWELPQDLAQQRRTLSSGMFASVRHITETRATEILRAQAYPLRCRAAAEYRAASDTAAASSVDTDYANDAREHLAALDLPDRCPRTR